MAEEPEIDPLHCVPVIHELRRHLRRFTWLALVAMLGLALAPSVSQALGTQASGLAGDICSAASNPGEPAGSGSGGAGTGLHVEHCALCGAASHAVGLPPAPLAELPTPEGADLVAAMLIDAAHSPFVWLPPPARASAVHLTVA